MTEQQKKRYAEFYLASRKTVIAFMKKRGCWDQHEIDKVFDCLMVRYERLLLRMDNEDQYEKWIKQWRFKSVRGAFYDVCRQNKARRKNETVGIDFDIENIKEFSYNNLESYINAKEILGEIERKASRKKKHGQVSPLGCRALILNASGYSYTQISKMTNVCVHTARVSALRARKSLVREFEK